METKKISSLIGSGASTAIAVFCPACWPAIGSLFGSLGLSVLATTTVLKPLLAIFLGVALLGFVRGYRAHRNPWPLWVGFASGGMLYAGKWVVFNLPLFYTGAAFLIASSIADTLLRRRAGTCCTTGQCKTTPRSGSTAVPESA